MFVANVKMAAVVDYLRRFHSSVATGNFRSAETEAVPILRRLDAFLSSHLGKVYLLRFLPSYFI